MKITRRQLRRIIREERTRLIEQPDVPDVMGAIGHGKFQPREEFDAPESGLFDVDYLYDLLAAEADAHLQSSGSDGLTRTEKDRLQSSLMEALRNIMEDYSL